MDMLTKIGLIELFVKLRDKNFINDGAFVILKELLFSEKAVKSIGSYEFLIVDLKDEFILDYVDDFTNSGIVEYYDVKHDSCVIKLNPKEIKALFKEYGIKTGMMTRLKNLFNGRNVLISNTYVVLRELFKGAKVKPVYYRYASIMMIFLKHNFDPNIRTVITDEMAKDKYGLKNARVLYSYLIPKMNNALKAVGYKIISKKSKEKDRLILRIART